MMFSEPITLKLFFSWTAAPILMIFGSNCSFTPQLCRSLQNLSFLGSEATTTTRNQHWRSRLRKNLFWNCSKLFVFVINLTSFSWLIYFHLKLYCFIFLSGPITYQNNKLSTFYHRLLLRKEGINFRTTAEFETVRTIKEKACYLANNPLKEETVDVEHLNYTLPDGNSIQIGPARFRAPEVLFRPDLIGEECEGLHEVLMFSILKSDLDLRKVLFKNIVLSGGSTLFKVRFLFLDVGFGKLKSVFCYIVIAIFFPRLL